VAIPVDSVHTARLTVPVSAVEADHIAVSEDPVAHTMTFTATDADSPQEARQKIKDFLDAARAAAQA
jgi:hypothetical protein